MPEDHPPEPADGRLQAIVPPVPPADAIADRRYQNRVLADALRQRRRSSGGDTRHHLHMAMLGLMAGSLVVIPSVLVATGRLGTWQSPREPATAAPASPASAGPAASQPDEALVLARPTLPDPPPNGRLLKPSPEMLAAEAALVERLETVRALLSRGEVLRAREMVSPADVAQSPEAAFLLAEAYDPNVLAGLSVTGVAAEAERARRLYSTALIGGIESARQRLRDLN